MGAPMTVSECTGQAALLFYHNMMATTLWRDMPCHSACSAVAWMRIQGFRVCATATQCAPQCPSATISAPWRAASRPCIW